MQGYDHGIGAEEVESSGADAKAAVSFPDQLLFPEDPSCCRFEESAVGDLGDPDMFSRRIKRLQQPLEIAVGRSRCFGILKIGHQGRLDVGGKDVQAKERLHQAREAFFPFLSMGIWPVFTHQKGVCFFCVEVNKKMSDFVDQGKQECIRVEIAVDGDPAWLAMFFGPEIPCLGRAFSYDKAFQGMTLQAYDQHVHGGRRDEISEKFFDG